MKKRLLTLLLALVLAVSLAVPAAAAQTQPVEVASALELAQAMAAPASPRGLLRARAAVTEPTRVVAFAPALADGYGADRVLHLAAWQEYVLEFSNAAAAQRALACLQADPDVTDCFLDEAVTADDTLAGLWDETASRSWGGHAMGLTTLRHQADVLLPAGRRTTVAVIDTGADCTHPLLAGRVSALSYDFANATADMTDVNGHGTATAGLIADLTPGEVDVMVLRVYGDDDLSKPSRVLTALEYALENGAAVVNMSLGWPNAIEKGYSFLNTVLAQAYASGVVVVTAAGNRSQSNPTGDADDVYPANQAAALTVSAVDRSRTFRDMPEPDFWSHAGLDYCIGAGLMAGTSDVTVSPEALATRAQIVQLLWVAAGSPETAGALPFTDVAPDAWYYAAVRWAYRTGLVAGTSATTFDPDAPITRQDFTVILYEQSGRPVTTGSALTAFPDVGSVAGYAYAALTWAVEQGLVSGVGADDGVRLTPRGYASRAQVAAILMLYCDRETA